MSIKKDSLGDRIKEYENISRHYLTKKMPVIIRIDGRAFHTFCKGLKKPWDNVMVQAMKDTSKYLCEHISGCKMAYVQSDEISLLLVDYDKPETQAWFGNNLQKIVSISASMATLAFNKSLSDQVHTLTQNYINSSDSDDDVLNYISKLQKKLFNAMFDARAFIIPENEVCNYFIWRQDDAIRNSVQMLGQYHFPSKQLEGVSRNRLIDKLRVEKDVIWSDIPTQLQRGFCIIKVTRLYENEEGERFSRSKWVVDEEIPLFVDDRQYVNHNVYIDF